MKRILSTVLAMALLLTLLPAAAATESSCDHDYYTYWTADDEMHTQYCLRCGDAIISGPHTYVDDLCTVCGYTYCAHTDKYWAANFYTHWQECAKCGIKCGDYQGHIYTDGICLTCGMEENHRHSYTAVVTQPTCTERGYTTYDCTCGDYYKSDFTEPTGHSYVDGLCTACGKENSFFTIDQSDSVLEKYYRITDIYTETEQRFGYEIPDDGVTMLIFFSNQCTNSQYTMRNLNFCEWMSNPYLNVVAVDCVADSAEPVFDFADTYTANVQSYIHYYYADNGGIPFAYLRMFVDRDVLMWPEVIMISDDGMVRYGTDCAMNIDDIYETLKLTSQAFAQYEADREQTQDVLGGACGDNLTWELDADGLLTITGTGDMVSFSDLTFPWSWYADQIQALVIGEGVSSISNGAFLGCRNLAAITLPESLASIGRYAFENCTALRTITFPADAPQIAEDAFQNVTVDVFYPVGNTTWTADIRQNYKGLLLWTPYRGEHIYSGAPVVTEPGCTEDGSIVYLCDCGDTYQEVLPATGHSPVTDYAVAPTATENGLTEGSHCDVCGLILVAQEIVPALGLTGTCGENLTWKLDGDGLLTISGTGDMEDYSAAFTPWFWDADRIVSIVVEEGVCSIGRDAFAYCEQLESVQLPGTVTQIGSNAFYGCSSLRQVSIQSGTTSIGDYAFGWCSALESLVLPDGVESIGEFAFGQCTSMESAVLAHGLTDIAEFAFYGCSSLKSIVIPAGVTSIGYSAFSGCGALQAVTIPDTVTTIGSWAFEDCGGLTELTIPASVELIGDSAFCECDGLRAVTFLGDAPQMDVFTFYGVTATMYYPGDNATWTAEVMENSSAGLTWVPYDASGHFHSYTAVVTAPTCTADGYTTYTCECSDSYVADEVPALGHSYVDGTCERCGAGEYIVGDISGDGNVNARDIRALLNILASGEAADPAVADFNGDGLVNARDARALLNHLAS